MSDVPKNGSKYFSRITFLQVLDSGVTQWFCLLLTCPVSVGV